MILTRESLRELILINNPLLSQFEGVTLYHASIGSMFPNLRLLDNQNVRTRKDEMMECGRDKWECGLSFDAHSSIIMVQVCMLWFWLEYCHVLSCSDHVMSCHVISYGVC